MANRPISRIVIVAVAFATSSLTALIRYNAEIRRPQLIYFIPYASLGGGKDNSFRTYSFDIENPGGATVSNIHGLVTLPTGDIVGMTANQPPVNTITLNGNTVEISIPRLEPQEKFDVIVMMVGASPLPENLDCSVRAAGIHVVEAKEFTKAKSTAWTGITLAALLAGVIPLGFLTAVNRAALSIKARSKYSGGVSGEGGGAPRVVAAENRVLAELCNRHGFESEAEKYLLWPHTCVYWAEADKQTIDLHRKSSEEVDARKDLLEDLLEYVQVDEDGVNASIIHYNIARITFFQGHLDEAFGHLHKASQTATRLIENRLKLEPELSDFFHKGKPE